MGLTQGELAKKIDVTQQSIYALEAGKTKKTPYILELAKALKTSPEWLLTGKGEDSLNTEGYENLFTIQTLDITTIASNGVITNNETIEIIQTIEYAKNSAISIFGAIPQESIKIINFKGDSMSGTFESGDLVFIDITKNFFDGDGIYAFVFDSVLYIKRLQAQPQQYRVISDNPNYEKWSIDKNQIENIDFYGKIIFSQSQAIKKHS